MTTIDAEQAIQQLRDEQTRIDAAAPIDLAACPDWCRHAENHPTLAHEYHSVIDPWDEPITFARFHTAAVARGVDVSQQEFYRDGRVWFGDAHVFVADAGDAAEMTSSGARERAAALLAAADRLDEIAVGGR